MSVGGSKGPPLKSREVLVPLVGLLFTALYLIYSIPFVPPSVSMITVVFTLIFFVSAFFVWRRSRVGFILGAVMSAVFILNFASDIGSFFANPSETGTFVGVATVLPALVATLVYSVLGAKAVWTKGGAARPGKTIPFSSIFALLVVGFVIGALLVGAFAGPTEARLLSSAGKTADVTIVLGAGNQGNPAGYFSPANYTVAVGGTVTWANADGVTHTVTSTSVPSGVASFKLRKAARAFQQTSLTLTQVL